MITRDETSASHYCNSLSGVIIVSASVRQGDALQDSAHWLCSAEFNVFVPMIPNQMLGVDGRNTTGFSGWVWKVTLLDHT